MNERTIPLPRTDDLREKQRFEFYVKRLEDRINALEIQLALLSDGGPKESKGIPIAVM